MTNAAQFTVVSVGSGYSRTDAAEYWQFNSVKHAKNAIVSRLYECEYNATCRFMFDIIDQAGRSVAPEAVSELHDYFLSLKK